MAGQLAHFRCISCDQSYPLSATIYNCGACGALLEVAHQSELLKAHSADQWRNIFDGRTAGRPGPDGSGVWRFREWVLPDLPEDAIITLGEGATPLTRADRLSERWQAPILIKQCGHTLSGSFKDLGMTVLVSQVNHMRQTGTNIPAVACASTGDTSAALAAYGAAAGIRTLVLLPRNKITAAQLVQPLAHGARVIAIDTDFDGCMQHVQKLCDEEGVYLANSKNSLRIEGQKTLAFEIAQGLDWDVPDWVAIPGGNLGNVSALVKGFQMLRDAGITTKLPRVICSQADKANPLFRSYENDFAPLVPLEAGNTQASAIRIGNPVSFPKAVAALKACDGVVTSVTESALAQTAQEADEHGLFVCPHTAVALAGARTCLQNETIGKGERVVVVATAHGLKFTEFKQATTQNAVPKVDLNRAQQPIDVPHEYAAVLDAALKDPNS